MTMSGDAAARVTGYLIVFGVLLGLTAATVGVSRIAMPPAPAIVVGLTIAFVKAALVALYFMHVAHERGMVLATLALTAIACGALFGLTLWTEAGHVPGTEFSSPYSAPGGTR